MSISIFEKNTYQKHTRTGVASNSLDLTGGATFLKRSSGFIAQATAASDRIIGVNQTEASFASDNQTVAKATVDFLPKECDHYYTVTISGGSLSAASEGSFFNLSAADTVNGATATTTPYYVNTSDAGAAADPVISMQLELVKYISATLGVFRIVNL